MATSQKIIILGGPQSWRLDMFLANLIWTLQKKKSSFWWGLSLTIRYDFWNLASTSQIWAPLKNIFFRGAQGPKVEE